MSATYWVLISDDMLFGDLDMMLPDGIRYAEPPRPSGETVPGPYGTLDPYRLPGAHWQLFEDDSAPPELDGCRVELAFRRGPGGLPEILYRRALA